VWRVHAVKKYRESGGVNLLILELGTRRKWAVNFTPQPLYPWEGTTIPI
jgi:hypothetical protein